MKKNLKKYKGPDEIPAFYSKRTFIAIFYSCYYNKSERLPKVMSEDASRRKCFQTIAQ